MNILSIDTSCDETAASVTENTKVISNIIWSQASLHAKFGGVMPSLAQRMHEERINFVIQKALKTAFPRFKTFSDKSDFDPLINTLIADNIDIIAVTAGPGLAIALGVGIAKAKYLAKICQKKLIAVNHLEGHVLSSFARPKVANKNIKQISFPALGLVISGGNTLLVRIDEIGKYKTLAATTDDALGEALDKAARMLGLGYPGGAILEKFAKEGNTKAFDLPVPMAGQEARRIFSYSGLKTAMYRLVESEKEKSKGILKKTQVVNLAAGFQNVAFGHLLRLTRYIIKNERVKINDLLVGGGVAANIEVRKRLRKLGQELNINIHFPYTNKLTGDNAAMIGIAAYYKTLHGKVENNIDEVDREANAKIDSLFKWQYNT